MTNHPLASLTNYSLYVGALLERPSVVRSTLEIWPASPYTGIAEGEIFFRNNLRLRMREELDFSAGLITSYGYEIYRAGERLYWYDDFPHPSDPALASTFPHHKHIPPDIKRHRISAPGISFKKPNLQTVIDEIEHLLQE
jgi:hypothetical protein